MTEQRGSSGLDTSDASAGPLGQRLHWLTRHRTGLVTFGVPWPRGAVAPEQQFELQHGDGAEPVQTWSTATWPDGSVKWSAHAVAAIPEAAAELALVSTRRDAGAGPLDERDEVSTSSTGDQVRVTWGDRSWTIPRTGSVVVSEATIGDRTIMRDLELVSLCTEGYDTDEHPAPRHPGRGRTDDVVVEQAGPIRAVVRIDGRHVTDDGVTWLPYRLRLVFGAGSDTMRVQHTITIDHDPDEFGIAGIGLRAGVPLRAAPYDRHVRLAGPAEPGERPGYLTEAVQPITGLRRDPGVEHRAAQVAGRPAGPTDHWDPAVADRIGFVPCWDSWRLEQHSADGFTLRKRTAPDRGWVAIPAGTRSVGHGYLGDTTGGISFGSRDFWQRHPARIDLDGMTTDTGAVTIWLWSPSAPLMDLRFYHDGLGQDTHADQLQGLEITYEDYEPGWGSALGVSRTHELSLTLHPATPAAEDLAVEGAALTDPGLLVTSPEHLAEAGVFGAGPHGTWQPRTDGTGELEQHLDFLTQHYRREVEQRRWYGFWDHGDVMHAYDTDRHQWRYDIGGFAWDNSELSPDLWLWLQFLRTGEARVFRLAEAMTRHTGEVDVHHLGRFAGFGSRHNVQHWGCSCKQARISSATYRRFLHHLTADERIGDLLDENLAAVDTFLEVDPYRKVRGRPYEIDRHALEVSLGTDWGALAAGWLSAWERRGDLAARDRLLGTMADIAALPQGFLTGQVPYDLDTGEFDTTTDHIRVSHLSAVFGLVEICTELVQLTEGTEWEVPGFAEAWWRYCRWYLASEEEQAAEFGAPLTGISLTQSHSRLTAWAASRANDPDLAAWAWHCFAGGRIDRVNHQQRQRDWQTTRVEGPTVLHPIDEVPWLSTNDAAQYGLTVIELLALLGAPPS